MPHGASVRLTDFCPRFKQFDRIFRPAMLVRRIEPLSGLPVIRLRIRPAVDVTAASARSAPSAATTSATFRASSALRLTTDAPLSYLESEFAFALTTPLNIILGPDETLPASIPHSVRDFQERSFDYWIEWSRYLSVPFEWQDAVIRAAITLKLCSFEDTGAIVAALTTSIPEAAAQRAQLGLPLLLAARCLSSSVHDPEPARRHAHDGGFPRLHHHSCRARDQWLN